MTTNTFQASELPLLKVFSNDFHFDMPLYQRPYAWEESNTEDLLDDLLKAMKEDGDQPYFLGSIVLTKQTGKNAFEVVDGQQRLTTLTMLFCVLRELADDEGDKQNLDLRVRESADRFAGTEDRFRLHIRERDREFFQDNVQKPGRLGEFVEQDKQSASVSRELIRISARYLWKTLQNKGPSVRDDLATFLVQKCYMVVVTASSRESAHRIFSVMNARGMDLSPTDILKSVVIGEIPGNSQDAYMAQWESIEEELGRDHFRELFACLYAVFEKRKPDKSLDQAFSSDILKNNNGTRFIDEVLIPYSDAYRMISEVSFHGTERDAEINRCLDRLKRLTGTISFWVAPAMEFIIRFSNDGEMLLRLLRDLERLTYGLLFLPVLRDSRRFRFERILAALSSEAENILSESGPLQLTEEERKGISQKLAEPLTFLQSHLKRALLLKLDELLADVGASYDHKTITIEHVLPQNPSETSEWYISFSEDERNYWTDRLANLVLLSRSKNASAQNFDFQRKKDEYFTRKGVAPFALTTQVLNVSEWTPEVLENRQKNLTQELSKEWRLT